MAINRWYFKINNGSEHLEPMAQDFHAAFGLNGEADKHIATEDADGVALAAIHFVLVNWSMRQERFKTRA